MTFIVFIDGGGDQPVEIVKLLSAATGSLNPGPTTLNMNVPALGVEADSRHIFVVAAGFMSGLSGITIGGAPGTLLVNRNPGSTIQHAIAARPMPTGSSTTVTFQFTNTLVKNFTAWVFSVYNLSALTVLASNTQDVITTSTTLNSSINTVTDGMVIGCGVCSAADAVASTSFASFENDKQEANNFFAFWEQTASAETPRSVSFTRGITTNAFWNASLLCLR